MKIKCRFYSKTNNGWNENKICRFSSKTNVPRFGVSYLNPITSTDSMLQPTHW